VDKAWLAKFVYRFYPALRSLPEYRVATELAKRYGCRAVLDVGCGRGNMGKILFDENVIDRYVGIDLYDPKLFRLNGDPRARYIRADARTDVDPGEYFDCLFFVNSLIYIGVEHIAWYMRFAKYGIVIDTTPSVKYPHVLLVDLLEGRARIHPKKLQKHLLQMGFKILELKYGQQYYVVFTQ